MRMKNGTKSARPAPLKTIHDGTEKDLLDLYIGDLSRTPVMPAEAQKELARVMRDSGRSEAAREQARDQLIRANLRFAYSVAKKYQNRGLPLEDLISEANAGLCRAADKYDPNVGVNFISYAVWWIRQSIFASITSKGRSVRLPLNRAGDMTRIARAQAVLRDKLTREPTLEEVARVTELTPEIVRSLIALMAPERSLDEPLGEADGPTFANVLQFEMSDEADAATAQLEDESRREALLRALEPLAPRDRRVLMMYYGLETGEPMTLDGIAQIFGVTRERVRQLRDRALKNVRSGADAETLRREWAA